MLTNATKGEEKDGGGEGEGIKIGWWWFLCKWINVYVHVDKFHARLNLNSECTLVLVTVDCVNLRVCLYRIVGENKLSFRTFYWMLHWFNIHCANDFSFSQFMHCNFGSIIPKFGHSIRKYPLFCIIFQWGQKPKSIDILKLDVSLCAVGVRGYLAAPSI